MGNFAIAFLKPLRVLKANLLKLILFNGLFSLVQVGWKGGLYIDFESIQSSSFYQNLGSAQLLSC